MQKITFIDGFCPFQDDDVTIEVKCTRYAPTGAPAYARIDDNMCESKSNCPYAKNCPVEDQTLLWNAL